MKLEPENAIVEAWRLQESIKKKRAEIRAEENQLKQIMALLESFNVTRIGKLERVSRLQHKRSIIPDQFRDRWPDLFNSLARVTLKDALEHLPEDELNQVCQISETVSWIIVSYEAPQVKRTWED